MPQAGGGRTPERLQEVRAEAGYAYGAVGADIHVFGDGTPVYLLFEHRRVTGLDAGWLRAQPSRMLDARAEVVEFVGRETEFQSLVDWRDAEGSLAVRWLHGEGGQGKTRLAAQLAAASQEAGWKVVDAVHGTETHPPAADSQDLRLEGCAGVLLLGDYADRWPGSHLSWLFHNRLLRQGVPARVLLLARSAGGWPAVRGRLGRLRENVDTSDQCLSPLPDTGPDRERLFRVARDGFARRHPGAARPETILPPGPLDHPDFGLTLAVLMAALVAVDAAVHGRRPPGGMVGLTTYLLDREHENWQQLYESSGDGLTYRTPAEVMARMVFIASLTGLTSRALAGGLLPALLPGTPPEVLLADHAVCYPPTDPARAGVLQPLLPDRLAEDFLALTLPGSPVTGYSTDDWAAAGCTTLLGRGADGYAPPWTARAVTFLAAAADRWPHVGHRHLYPALRRDPDLGAAAGSSALVQLAGIEDVDLAMLEAVDDTVRSRTGEERHADLDVGAAATCERVTRHRLAAVTDPVRRMELLSRLGLRLTYAGRHAEAAMNLGEAVDLGRHRMAEADASVMPEQATALNRLSRAAADAGLLMEAFRFAAEACEVGKALIQADPETYLPTTAASFLTAGDLAEALGRPELALDLTEEAVATLRLLVRTDPDSALPRLAQGLSARGARLRLLGRHWEAAQPTMDAMAIFRELARSAPAAHLTDFARSLRDFGITLSHLDKRDEAADAFEQAATVLRRLVERNPSAHLLDLADVLARLGSELSALGRAEDALSATAEAVAIHRREMGSSFPHVAGLGDALRLLGLRLSESDRGEQAAEAVTEAVAIGWALAKHDPVAHFPALARNLADRGRLMRRLGRLAEAENDLRQAVAIQRTTAEHDPAGRQQPLARTLDDLAGVLGDTGRPDEARAAVQEATAIRHQALRQPPPHPPRPAAPPATAQPSPDRGPGPVDPVRVLETAVSVQRRLVQQTPAAHLPVLAVALFNLAQRHYSDGRPAEAVVPIGEAVELYRRLTRDDARYLPTLATALNAQGSVLYALNRYESALAPIEEAGEIHRRLAGTDPDTYRARLASSLGRIGLVLHDMGRADRAQKVLLEAAALRRLLPPGDLS
ncbi:tetratricopeptide repeat protein [Streptomyces sp. 5-8]|uniref:Tetratricopeptide repeat protein n=1 Tax=Streptomyces musisoli TaxID=2802280 RepID=A0ABS1PD55_9ACTN|nr:MULTISPECIES: tetratricopeptide repeat protein [Streptomyces]MBL1110316.1 tetratricopeptide repeat protein [Streptomyces musisoli]MBY8846826.1 tetratricopeptide repeat protein [Streptomyces sp. SP2-10]